MFLRTGLVSFGLLLASRLLGLLRETAQAAALGTSGLADLAVLMLTLPDLLTGVLAAGALSYVLLPLWARQPPALQAATQSRLGRILLATGLLVGAGLVAAPELIVGLLAPGLSAGARVSAQLALGWSALALPLALLAALWTTRLQHRRDFTGMYGANLVVNAAVIGALGLVAASWAKLPVGPVVLLGLGLLLGGALRLVWLHWRLARTREPVAPDAAPAPNSAPTWPRPNVWLWALASAGLPLLLPLLGRSLASGGGEGALTTFNYAWKLVELPLVLAVQLVATLSFPALARVFAATPPLDAAASAAHREQQQAVLRQAFTLAWVLACAAAAALSAMSLPLAQLLYGWGRMTPEAVQQVAAWSRIGAWSLLPQALLAVLLTLMASTGRLRGAVHAYLGALAVLALLGWVAHQQGGLDGRVVMWGINAALTLAAGLLWWRERGFLQGVLRGRDTAVPALAAALLAVACSQLPTPERLPGLGLALLIAAAVVALTLLVSPALRLAVRR
ncbi:lipid II flippase MurJ [Hydrogenophaga sp.]|uniref:lipid II flippase MurJ n=1 Tax=Hydrogenophaga sp. TaxID=1904254 RepID=UPI0035630FC5